MSGSYPPIEKDDAAYREVARILGPAQCIQTRDCSVVQISNRYIKGDVFVSNVLTAPTMELGRDGAPATRKQRFRIPKDSFLAKRARDRT